MHFRSVTAWKLSCVLAIDIYRSPKWPYVYAGARREAVLAKILHRALAMSVLEGSNWVAVVQHYVECASDLLSHFTLSRA